MRTAHFLNGPLSIGWTTHPSIGGPLGDQKFSLISHTASYSSPQTADDERRLFTIRKIKPNLSLGQCSAFRGWTSRTMCSTLHRIGRLESSHILSRGPPTGCHHCGQTLTIDHMPLECALLQDCRDEYYTVDSLNALFETIPETCIVEFLREAGFFYLIWCNLLTSTSPQTCTIWSDLSNYLENESNSETHLLV